MLNRTELLDKILVTVAEQYFIFNEDNPDAITQFVEFYRSSSTLKNPLELTSTEDYLCIEFDTSWSPVCEVSKMLSAHYQCEALHLYAEQGMAFCGRYTFVNGEPIDELYGDRLIFSEDDDSGWPNVIGPDYIMELDHFGS